MTCTLAGFRYVILSPNLLEVPCRSFVFGFTAMVTPALLPLTARVKAGAITYGVMLGFLAWVRSSGPLSSDGRAKFSATKGHRGGFFVLH